MVSPQCQQLPGNLSFFAFVMAHDVNMTVTLVLSEVQGRRRPSFCRIMTNFELCGRDVTRIWRNYDCANHDCFNLPGSCTLAMCPLECNVLKTFGWQPAVQAPAQVTKPSRVASCLVDSRVLMWSLACLLPCLQQIQNLIHSAEKNLPDIMIRCLCTPWQSLHISLSGRDASSSRGQQSVVVAFAWKS